MSSQPLRFLLAAAAAAAALLPAGAAQAAQSSPRSFLEHAVAQRVNHPDASAAGGGPRAQSASILWQGFPPQPPHQVGAVVLQAANGKLYSCSGTLVSRSVILTAAHCVYMIGHGYDRQLVFAPGLRWNGARGVVTPYGVYRATRAWVPSAYRHRHRLVDYAFLQLGPRADGALPGAVAGVARMAADTRFHRGQRVFELGYPAAGFFATAAGHFGLDPFACYTTVSRVVHSGRFKAILSRCTMNAGASGGPWFMVRKGRPTVVGINDWCTGPDHCQPVARNVASSYFGRRFVRLRRAVKRAGAL